MAHLRTSALQSDSVLQHLDILRAKNKMPHAVCFSGVDYGSKKDVAAVVAQDLLCEASGTQACGQCGSCLRVAKHQSELLLTIEPEKEQIKLAETRKIMDFLSLSTNGRPRVVVIHQAHLLNLNSANSILKTIEEPQSEVYFILLTVDEKNLIPTIRSRVQMARFNPPGLDEITRQRFPEAEIELARHSAELLHLFWADDGFLRNEDWREHFKDRERAVKTVRYWLTLGRNGLAAQEHFEPHFDKWERFIKVKMQKDFKKIFGEFLNALVRVELELARFIDASLLIESLWVNYARGTHYGDE